MKCLNCDAPLEEDAKYCPKCGFKRIGITNYFLRNILIILLSIISIGILSLIMVLFIIGWNI